MDFDINIISMGIKNKHYRYIGSGSGRKVYDIGNGYVVKVAKNIKGLAQNEVEFLISSDSYSDLFATVHFASYDFKYLIMDLAKPIKKNSYFLNYFDIPDNKALVNIDSVRDIHDKYDLVWADLFKITSWGIINGRIVLVDYGFTKEVSHKYYKKNKKSS